MQIEKSFTLRAPAAAVWEFLTDPVRVAGCLPGAAITGQVDEKSYGGTMTVKVGPVTASYRGTMRFERLDAAAREAEIVASGQETRGKGGADMRMTSRVVERAPNETEVTVVSVVNIVGVLAQLGGRMIQDVSDQLFQKFTECMRRQLETPAAATAPAPVAALAADVPTVAAPPPPAVAEPQPLDLGALGAAAAGRAATRALRRPAFWIAVLVVAAVVYWFLSNG
ncbi:MAG TPA: SRPBCC family protein [Thermoanaerobaculia bacterium]|nr:SRPBCC family protein [Thermoanaerobaculia bacterium]